MAADKVPVSVPIILDYPLLRHLLVKQLFTGPGESREVLNQESSCNQVVLTEPQISPAGANLRIDAQVAAQVGVNLLGRCRKLLEWQGGVGFLGLPHLKPGGTSLGLKSQELWLTRADGERMTSGRMWDSAQAPLRELFSSFTINLSPLTVALGSFLPEVVPDRSAEEMQETLDSLQLGSLHVSPEGLEASLDFVVASLAEPLPPEGVLSPEELEQWENRWQTMDALLVFAVKHYAAATHLQELRGTLLDILIDSRYQLVEALAKPADRSNDVVRAWFLESWQRLSPVVRSIALEQEGQESFMWLSVLAATDALYAMDQLGPQIGLQISVHGLRRLARMINQGTEVEELLYDDAVDPELQQLFQEQIQLKAAKPSAWNFRFSLLPQAYAAAPVDRLDRWVPNAEDIGEYLPMVSALLDNSAGTMLKKYQLDNAYPGLYRNLVLATAWQESCWRQFVEMDGRIEPLISSTGDIGLMQLNERVWRGFYDMQKLRWDINYNSLAGAEVLLDYLVKYAIRKNEHRHTGGLDNLARASYSAYNGGPGKASRYRRTDVSTYHQKIDAAFWKKYQRVNEGNLDGIARCLGAIT